MDSMLPQTTAGLPTTGPLSAPESSSHPSAQQFQPAQQQRAYSPRRKRASAGRNKRRAASPDPQDDPEEGVDPSGNREDGGEETEDVHGKKMFQCKGYGNCRMSFSRSEHLARHIR